MRDGVSKVLGDEDRGFPPYHGFLIASFSHDGKYIVSCHVDGAMRLWGGRLLRRLMCGRGLTYDVQDFQRL